MYRIFDNYCRANKFTRQDIANWLGKSVTYVGSRVTRKQLFTIDDLYIICERANIPYEEIPYYFPKGGKLDFSEKYQQNLEILKGANPLSFADVLLNVGKAMKKIEQSELNENVISLLNRDIHEKGEI